MTKTEQTLAIIKPDAVGSNYIGDIINYWEKEGLLVVGAVMTHLTKQNAEEFYAVHKERPFFKDLVKFMTSGPVLALVLQGENAVNHNRKIMGHTDPQKADKGTIRHDFASSIEANAVHGSDSSENAAIEIAFFHKHFNLKVFAR
jgi:nucleoside-diphosphate kinase